MPRRLLARPLHATPFPTITHTTHTPCSYDDSGPQLFQVDPSGAYFGWRASAIGKNFVNAKTFLEKVRSARAQGWLRALWGPRAARTRAGWQEGAGGPTHLRGQQ